MCIVLESNLNRIKQFVTQQTSGQLRLDIFFRQKKNATNFSQEAEIKYTCSYSSIKMFNKRTKIKHFHFKLIRSSNWMILLEKNQTF